LDSLKWLMKKLRKKQSLAWMDLPRTEGRSKCQKQKKEKTGREILIIAVATIKTGTKIFYEAPEMGLF